MSYQLDSSFSLKINSLIRLTNHQSAHGDYDHMGEAINLVNNFKVVFFFQNLKIKNPILKSSKDSCLEKK